MSSGSATGADLPAAPGLGSLFRPSSFAHIANSKISFQPPNDFDDTGAYLAAAGYVLPSAPFQSDLSASSSSPPSIMPMQKLDNGVTPNPIGTPSSATQILIRRLPAETTDQSLRLMFVWSEDIRDAKILPADPAQDDGTRSAVVTFGSHNGAVDAREKLNGRAINSNSTDGLVISILPKTTPRQGSAGDSPPNGRLSSTSSTASSASGSRQSSHVNGRLRSMDAHAPALNNGYLSQDLANSEIATAFPSTFNRLAPIGSHRSERTGVSSKALINEDSAADAETNKLLWDTTNFPAEGSPFPETRINSQRRATAPQIPLNAGMAGLSLNTNSGPQPASLPPYSSSASAHPNMMSPLSGVASPMGFPNGNNQPFGRPLPAANPADQNPPCNTLYVGNLPLDTSEEELKATFSKQRGYKRLCFRTKANGPMCFVEFEDISFATKALNELYGHVLHNSTKGGIRLSFSKNPLGVRSGHGSHQSNGPHMGGHMNHMMAGPSNHFPSANGPPPGLAAPPGLGATRQSFATQGSGHTGFQGFPSGRQNGWNRGHSVDNHPNSHHGYSSSSGFVPPHMMGR